MFTVVDVLRSGFPFQQFFRTSYISQFVKPKLTPETDRRVSHNRKTKEVKIPTSYYIMSGSGCQCRRSPSMRH